MGCGKSSVGRGLSQLLCCRFMDLDEEIVIRAGKSIPEIFAEDGQAAFRTMERDILADLLASVAPGQRAVIALGGGTVMTPECAKIAKEKTLCVYLRATVDTLIQHLEGQADSRPLLASEQTQSKSEALRSRIVSLMEQRSETYLQTAHLIIDTDGKKVREIAEEIAEKSID